MTFTTDPDNVRFASQDEADDECDARNAELDVGQAWQAAFVNDGDGDYWTVSLEDTDDQD